MASAGMAVPGPVFTKLFILIRGDNDVFTVYYDFIVHSHYTRSPTIARPGRSPSMAGLCYNITTRMTTKKKQLSWREASAASISWPTSCK